MDYCPFYDFNSSTLYFTSRRSSQVIETKIENIEDLINILNSYENGLNKIYKIKFNPND